MGLYGAYYSGLSGMKAQSGAIAAASDNITNTNTVGYKKSDPKFLTLVSDTTTSSSSYSSGAVQLANRTMVDEQGMIQSTGIVSDIAVSGKGMLVVNDKDDGSGNFLFTRAGSFRQDAKGNFVNSAGMTLMAWPVDNEGRIPGQSGNLNTISNALLDSLDSVNLKSVSGAVSATSNVKIAANLDSAQEVLEGAGQTISIVNTSTENYGIGLDDLIVPNGNMEQGEMLKIYDGSTNYTYVYGGITSSNNVTGGIFGAINNTQLFTTGITNGDQFTISNAQIGTLTFTFTTNVPDTSSGYFNNLTTLADALDRASGITARIQGNRIFLSAEDANQGLTFANVGAATLVGPLGFTNIAASSGQLDNDGVASTFDITATAILGSSTTGGTFTATATDTFTITTPALGTITYTFVAGAPGAGQFNTLSNLATAINATSGLEANILNNVLTIKPTTPTDTMTFGFTGTNFPTAFGIADTAALPGTAQRFSTLSALSDMINNTTGIAAKATSSGVTSATLKIYNVNPLGTISYDYAFQLPSTTANMLSEFSLTRNVSSATMTSNYDTAKGTPSTTPTGPSYDPLGANAGNMAGGTITPHFSRNFEVYDPLGNRHDFRISFVKLNVNQWGVEVYVLNPDDIISSTGRTDGMVASGNVVFNGDGSLKDVTPALLDEIDLSWSNGALDSAITLFLGTAGAPAGTAGATQIGLRDGLSQIRSDYNVQFVEQNGVSAALLSSINIDSLGFIIANYSNGLSQKLFKIPLADFPNVNGLTVMNGNVYSANQSAGAFNLREAATGGAGTIQSSALEQSNAELADELTRLVVAQRAYEADSQIISAVNELLKQLNRLFG